MRDVAHPQLVGVAEGEAAAVGAVRGLFVEQALAAEQPVHGRGGERMVDAVLDRRPDDAAYRLGGVVGLQGDEALGDLGGIRRGCPRSARGLG